jgi:hypothetical protein
MVNAHGMDRQLQFVAMYNGTDVPVSGNAAAPRETASVKLIDQYTCEVVWTIPEAVRVFTTSSFPAMARP